MTYKGYGYPKFLQNEFMWKMWKKFCCKRGWHLWDEVYTTRKNKPFSYLHCDACGETIRTKEMPEKW
jgi:hypothetical protein